MPNPPSAYPDRVYLIASGDQRESANRQCWPAQHELESLLEVAFRDRGIEVVRAHRYSPERGHGFIGSQRDGLDVTNSLPPDAWVVVAIAAWQYSHHVLPGLLERAAPILTVANWSGTWPGLVGLLNLNACLTKAQVPYSTIWSEKFDDVRFGEALDSWLGTGRIAHDSSHVTAFDTTLLPEASVRTARKIADGVRRDKVIIGVFDEGCMGMSNAVIEDRFLNRLGVFKERLSQSALLAEMGLVTEAEAAAVIAWLRSRGMRFETGTSEESDLTEHQLVDQGRMYIAAARMADAFGCDAIGIQYQQGLKDMAPASDLVEGLLNNPDRPPVRERGGTRELYAGRALTHFNEVDEGSAVDGVITDLVWRSLGLDPSNTLHDVRWGEEYDLDGHPTYVWTWQISGAVPASHLSGGYAGAHGFRQPAMYFPRGGSTLAGVCRPGELVWSRVYVADDALNVDLGRGRAVQLPVDETERRRRLTTYAWPIMHAVLDGVSRDQMMARHQSNHVQVAYAPDRVSADEALHIKGAVLAELGLRVHLCGIGYT